MRDTSYPGDPAFAVKVQQEIDIVTGRCDPIERCTCGRPPIVVSVGPGMIRVACYCGAQGPNSRDHVSAVKAWNRHISDRKLEALR